MSTPIVKLLDNGPVDRVVHLKTICDALGITTSSKLKKPDLKAYIYDHITIKPESESKVREMISNINTEAKRQKTDSVSSQPSPIEDEIPATPPSPTTVTTTVPTTTTTATTLTTTPATTMPITTTPPSTTPTTSTSTTTTTSTSTTTTFSLPTRPVSHTAPTTSTTKTKTTPTKISSLITQPASQVNLFDVSTEEMTSYNASVFANAESMDCEETDDSQTDPKRKMTEETDDEGLENKDKRTRFEYDNDDIRKLASACSRILNDKEERDKERANLYKTADQWREIYLNSERRRKKLEVDFEKRNEEISQITDKLNEIKLRLNNLDKSAKDLQQQKQQQQQQHSSPDSIMWPGEQRQQQQQQQQHEEKKHSVYT